MTQLTTPLTGQNAILGRINQLVAIGILLSALVFVSTSSEANDASIKAETRVCPSDFNSVKIPDDGKFCQVFAADFPASMVLHIPQSPAAVIDYYSAEYPIVKEIKSRTLLQTADKNTTLIISEDGEGTQVDILVKSI
ncbi:MAG: hypothetical protein AAGJ37_05395 [Pseudomonadota bacterium]